MQERKHIPVRMCVACGSKMPKHEMTRFTCPSEPGRGLAPDRAGKAPGRGFYLCPEEECAGKFGKYKGWRRKCKGESDDR